MDQSIILLGIKKTEGGHTFFLRIDKYKILNYYYYYKFL